MNPDIWRKRRVIPEELKTMLDEIYAIDLVLARGFSQEYIWDEETKLYWNSNSQYSVANFYNGISHSDFPKYAVEKVDKVSSYCDSLIMETDDEKLKKSIHISLPESYKETPEWLQPYVDMEVLVDKLLGPFKQILGLFDVTMADTRGGFLASRMLFI